MYNVQCMCSNKVFKILFSGSCSCYILTRDFLIEENYFIPRGCLFLRTVASNLPSPTSTTKSSCSRSPSSDSYDPISQFMCEIPLAHLELLFRIDDLRKRAAVHKSGLLKSLLECPLTEEQVLVMPQCHEYGELSFGNTGVFTGFEDGYVCIEVSFSIPFKYPNHLFGIELNMIHRFPRSLNENVHQ